MTVWLYLEGGLAPAREDASTTLDASVVALVGTLRPTTSEALGTTGLAPASEEGETGLAVVPAVVPIGTTSTRDPDDPT